MKSNGFELFACMPPTLAAAIITIFGLFSLNQLLTEAKSAHKSNIDMQTALNHQRMKNASLLVGISLSIAGIINSDEEDTISWELFSGMGLLIATYLYDRYIQLNK